MVFVRQVMGSCLKLDIGYFLPRTFQSSLDSIQLNLWPYDLLPAFLSGFLTFPVLRRIRKIAKSHFTSFVMSVCRRKTRLPCRGFYWNVIFEYFSKICPVNSSVMKIWQEYKVLVFIYLYRVSQEECARLWESVPYVKVYRYNPKLLYPKLNGYGDNGQRKVGASCGSKYCKLHSWCVTRERWWPWEWNAVLIVPAWRLVACTGVGSAM